MMFGPESRNKLNFTVFGKLEPSDGPKKKLEPDGASTPGQVENLEAPVEAASQSDQSGSWNFRSNFLTSTNSSRTNSKSPMKSPRQKFKTSKIQPFTSPADDPIENLKILRSDPGEPVRSKPKHVAFNESNLERCKPCSRCSHTHYAANAMPWRTVSVEELRIATNNYNLDNSIEINRYEDVLFKGTLDGCPVYVSSKRSDEIQLSLLSEIGILKNLRHPNVISLRASCEEINNQALVFSFVCSRTVAFHLSPGNYHPVPWPKRENLAIKLAKALVYLHHECSVIHGNINSGNVLVTHDFVPVIGDFSLSRSSAVNRQHFLQDRSTDKKARGYLAPEYQRRGEASEKQDIYAFGVILVELMSGLVPFDKKREIRFLDEWGRTMIDGLQRLAPLTLLDVSKIADPRMTMPSEITRFSQMIRVAKLCLHEDPTKRPSMIEVLELLQQGLKV